MKHNVMFFNFTHMGFNKSIQFKHSANNFLINDTKTVHFIVDIANYDKQDNDILRTIRFISYIAALSIYIFFNRKVNFEQSLKNYYMMPDEVITLPHLKDGSILKHMTDDTEKLSLFLHKSKDVFTNSIAEHNLIYDDFYNYCDENHIKNFIKITIDYKLHFNILENIIDSIIYEYCIIE